MPGSLCLVAEVHSITRALFKGRNIQLVQYFGKGEATASCLFTHVLSSNAARVIKPLGSYITLGTLFLSLPSVSDANIKCKD